MKLTIGLLLVLLSNVAIAATPAPSPTVKEEGGLVDRAQTGDNEEDSWEMVGCTDFRSECRTLAKDNGYNEWRSSTEASSCPSTAYACYGK